MLIKCSCCGKDTKEADFYASKSHFMKATGKVHTCKSCVWAYVIPEDKTSYNMEIVYETLQALDKPFLDYIWISSYESSEKNEFKTDVFKFYMKNIGMKDFINMTWADSVFENEDGESVEDRLAEDYNVEEDIVLYWGYGYTEEDYDFLEAEKSKLLSSFECLDYGMEMLLKDIALLNLDIDNCRRNKEQGYQKMMVQLIDTRSKLMADAKIKPTQNNNIEEDDQFVLGVLIKKWENEKPIPKPLADEMKEYIDTYMIGHLAKMEGLDNDMTRKYDAELAKYTINHSEIGKDKEEWDD